MKHIRVDEWNVYTNSYEKTERNFYQSIFSQGNGYLGLRGFGPEERKANLHEKNTFIAGVFEYIKPGITDMVNTPDFSSTVIRIDDTEVDYDRETIKDFCQIISMKNGLFMRKFILSTKDGKETEIILERFPSQADVHIAVIRAKITPLNHNVVLAFETGIDGEVANNPISDDQLAENDDVVKLLEVTEVHAEERNGYLFLETGVSGNKIAEAFRIELSGFGQYDLKPVKKEKYAGNLITASLEKDKTYIIDKYVCVYTYRDLPEEKILEKALIGAENASGKGFERLLRESSEIWMKKWKYSDIEISGDKRIQGAIRYNIFQLIQTYNESDERISIGARGIMHGRYKGCYFWDTEIFMLPFYIYTNPKAARNLLKFRYNTLESARQNAKALSLKGARYPWMCSSHGLEQCESWDTGCCEVHITADVAYAVDNYVKISGDSEFLVNYGAEILIETARYWVSRFTYDSSEDIYNLIFVKGPNEYGGCTTNNTYTNWMAVNNLRLAENAVMFLEQEYPDKWKELSARLRFDKKEIDEWNDIIKKAKINYDRDKDLYIEDDLFMRLEPLDISRYKTDDKPLYYKISYDRLQRYRVLKQADVLLLMTLFPDKFTNEQKNIAWNFYEPLTLHDSSLSFGTHAQLAAQLGIMDKANEYLHKSLFLDLYDVMGNTGKEGLHFAAFGASWQAVVFGFAGISHDKEGVKVTPRLPEGVTSIKFYVIFRNELWCIEINSEGGRAVKVENMK